MTINCSVCWELLAAAVEPNGGGPVNTDIITTRCGHLYHTICLQNWLETQHNAGCPTCRTAISIVDCMKLYPSRDDAETEGGVSKIKEMKQKIKKLEVYLKGTKANVKKERKVQKSLKVQLNSNSIELDSVKEMLIDERRKWILEKSNFINKILKLEKEKEERIVDLAKAKRQREVDLEKANANAKKERMAQTSLSVQLINERRKWKWEESNFIDIVAKLKEEKEKREVDLKKAKRQHNIERILLVIFSFALLREFGCHAKATPESLLPSKNKCQQHISSSSSSTRRVRKLSLYIAEGTTGMFNNRSPSVVTDGSDTPVIAEAMEIILKFIELTSKDAW